MHFDASPRTLHSLDNIMRQDPRVIRLTVLKQGSRIEDMAKSGQLALKGDNIRASDLMD